MFCSYQIGFILLLIIGHQQICAQSSTVSAIDPSTRTVTSRFTVPKASSVPPDRTDPKVTNTLTNRESPQESTNTPASNTGSQINTRTVLQVSTSTPANGLNNLLDLLNPSGTNSSINELLTNVFKNFGNLFPQSNQSGVDMGRIIQQLLPMLTGGISNSTGNVGNMFSSLLSGINNGNGSEFNMGNFIQQLIPLLNGGLQGIPSSITKLLSQQLIGNLDQCSQDLLEVLKDLTTFKMWALQMLDASGKPQRNLLQGNNIWFGSYDDCRKIHHIVSPKREINGAYAEVTISLPKSLTDQLTGGLGIIGTLAMTLRWDLCVPQSCSSERLKSMLNIAPLQNLNLSITSVTIGQPLSIEGDTAAYVSIAILGCFVLLCLIGTLWDAVQDRYTILPKHKESAKDNDCHKHNGMNGVHLNEIKVNGDKTDLYKANGIHEKSGEDNPGFTHESTVDSTYVNGKTNGVVGKGDVKPTEAVRVSQTDSKSLCSRMLLAFSALENGRKILNCSNPPGSLGCLHGIRVMSMAWVILGHFILTLLNQIENRKDLYEMSKTYWFQVIANGTLSVDTFFFLSGLLVSYLFLKEVKKIGKLGCKQMTLFYFHRYWRLTPLYMIVIMIYTNLSPYFGEGPMASPVTQGSVETCRRNWWTNLLYINNLYKSSQTEMCMAWSWYLANDMQFYVVSPLALVPLALGYKVIGMLVIFGLFAGQIIAGGYIGWDIGDPGLFTTNAGRFFDEMYIKPYVRMGVYAVGLLLGYIINKTKGKQRIPTIALFIGNILAATVGLLVTYVTYDQFRIEGNLWNSDENIAFQALFRPAWALVLFWLVFICIHGYGGIVNSILSWGAWIPLSRLTYAAYLIHLIVMTAYATNMRTYAYLTGFHIINTYIGLFVVTYACSYVLSVVVEAPFLGLEKILLGKFK